MEARVCPNKCGGYVDVMIHTSYTAYNSSQGDPEAWPHLGAADLSSSFSAPSFFAFPKPSLVNSHRRLRQYPCPRWVFHLVVSLRGWGEGWMVHGVARLDTRAGRISRIWWLAWASRKHAAWKLGRRKTASQARAESNPAYLLHTPGGPEICLLLILLKTSSVPIIGVIRLPLLAQLLLI